MTSPVVATGSEEPGADLGAETIRLGSSAKGVCGTVVKLSADANSVGGYLAVDELERRLLEIGFVEGAAVEILHEGFIRRDPIAVRLDDMQVALRRRDADAVLVSPSSGRLPIADAGN